jgi:hypothetical protein
MIQLLIWLALYLLIGVGMYAALKSVYKTEFTNKNIFIVILQATLTSIFWLPTLIFALAKVIFKRMFEWSKDYKK